MRSHDRSLQFDHIQQGELIRARCSKFCYTFLVMNRPSKSALVHVVNNKLNVIIATCDLLFQRATDPEVVARVHVIHTAAQALADEFNKPLSRSTGA